MPVNELPFLRTALQHYSRVGTLWPSSKGVSRKIAKAIESQHEYVVEAGAGNGAVTRAILDRLSPKARLVAIEVAEELIPSLHEIHDSRLRVVEGDATRLTGLLKRLGVPRVDAIVSGIPLSFLKAPAREKFIRAVRAVLRPGGLFIAYQVSPVSLRVVKKYFSDLDISFYANNFPPYFVATAAKNGLT